MSPAGTATLLFGPAASFPGLDDLQPGAIASSAADIPGHLKRRVAPGAMGSHRLPHGRRGSRQPAQTERGAGRLLLVQCWSSSGQCADRTPGRCWPDCAGRGRRQPGGRVTFPCRLDTTDPGARVTPRVCLTRPKFRKFAEFSGSPDTFSQGRHGAPRMPQAPAPLFGWCTRRPGSDGPAETPEERVVVKGRSGTGFSFRDHHAG